MIRRVRDGLAAHPVAAFLAVFAVFPFLVPYRALATQVLIYGLFALGFNLLYGYTGLLSFGHAAYFGLGAYGAGIALARLGLGSVWAALAMGLGAATLGGAVIGFFCLRRRGIYFAMLTLAFAQIAYAIVHQWYAVTGGDNGLLGIWPAPWLATPIRYYYLALAACAGGIALLDRIGKAPFGLVLRAARDHARRAETVGVNVRLHQWLAFVIAGFFGGLAGATFVFLNSPVQLVLTHHVAHLVGVGQPKVFVANIVGLVGLVSVAGKILWGYLSDRWWIEVNYLAGIAFLVGGILALIRTGPATPAWGLYAYAVLMGFGYAVSPAMTPVLSARFFTGRHFGAIFGALNMLHQVAGASGMWLAGYARDVTGSYTLPFTVSIASACLSLACVWLAAPRRVRP